ncbi:MAG: hypothetical protein FJW34_05475 [Acidobacteria bacterium]|nr:hypothetical protein [Acidobacteriota bacterium]
MTKKLVITFLMLALAVACAKTYHVTLFQPSVIGGTELKAGEYRLELNGDKVVLKNGKHVAESTVKVEDNGEKFSRTSVRYDNGDGKYRVQEIRLGGTNIKLAWIPTELPGANRLGPDCTEISDNLLRSR